MNKEGIPGLKQLFLIAADTASPAETSEPMVSSKIIEGFKILSLVILLLQENAK